MKKRLASSLFAMVLSAFSLSAQETLPDSGSFEPGHCDSFIRQGRLQPADSLPAQVCFLIGVCLMQRSEYAQALDFLEYAVEKNHDLAPAYLYKAEVLLRMNRLEEAIVQYDNAIYLRPDVPDFLVSKGYALFLSGRHAEAEACYREALALPACPEKTYALLGRALQESGQTDRAVEAFALGTQRLSPHSEHSLECLHRLGLAQYLRGKLPEAESAFRRVLDLTPGDYQAVSRLIQVYYAAGQYEKGKALKMGLYGAYRKGLLKGDWLEKGFCFDQFEWKGKRIYAYERFDEPAGFYPKHVFYVTDQKDQVLEVIQTEHTLEASLRGKKYTMGRLSGDIHEQYDSVAFDDNFEYPALKKAVIRILRGKEKAGRIKH